MSLPQLPKELWLMILEIKTENCRRDIVRYKKYWTGRMMSMIMV